MLEEVTMATEADNDNTKAGRARARLASRLKAAADKAKSAREPSQKRSEEEREYTSFKTWLKDVKDMVRVRRDPPKPVLAAETAATKRRDALDASVRQSRLAGDTGDDNHIHVPVRAVTKAALGDELYGISMHIQGYVLAHSRAGVANYVGDRSSGPLGLTSEQRGQLVAMHTWVHSHLPVEMRKMANIVIDQTLHLKDKPPLTVSEVGAMITQSEDERVRKGGVVGYYRAMFQTIRQLQMEWHITHAIKRIK